MISVLYESGCRIGEFLNVRLKNIESDDYGVVMLVKGKTGPRRKMLKELANKIGLNKPVNPHIFKKARATHLASKLTEAQMCEYFGWIQGSDMPSTHVHLSGRDIDNAILRSLHLKRK